MTTRFSIADLSEMLHESVDVVREAVENLAKDGDLTAETFVYAERNWRVAPSDVKRITAWIEDARQQGRLSATRATRNIRRKQVIQVPTEPE